MKPPQRSAPRELSEVELRLLEKRAAARRIFWGRIGKYVAICLSVTIVVWGLVFSPLFKVTNFVLDGIDNSLYPEFVDRDKLNDTLDSYMNEGAVSLVMLSSASVESELNKIHGISNTSVVKVWPNTLVITVEPKEPVGKIGDQLIDENGSSLGTWEPGMLVYPEVNCAPAAFKDCLLMLENFKKEPVFAPPLPIAKVSATTRDDLTVLRADGFNIIFGNTNEITLKLAVLNKVLVQDLGGRKTIDLSAGANPVAR